MGTLDFLKVCKNRVLDAATYELLERNFQLQVENGRLYKEKAEQLEQENAKLNAENRELRGKVNALTEKLAQITEAAEYEICEGFAFRRKADGSFDVTPYCPNCHNVMGHLMRGQYQCSNCKHIQSTGTLPEVFARQLNARSKKNST